MKKKTIVKVLTTLYQMCVEHEDCNDCNLRNFCILGTVIDCVPLDKIEMISDIIKQRVDKEK